MKYQITNWRDHQHYKDRNPPWIKLHFCLLSSEDWVSLNDAGRVLVIACMLVGSRTEGVIDGSPKGLDYLRRVAYLNTKPDLKPLVSLGFLTMLADASTMLADASALQANARPETETETEEETETQYCAEPEADSTRQQEFVMQFPCKGCKAKSFGLTQTKLDEWLETYGASLNVPHELRTARQWLLDNPGRQKTDRGMTKFLGGWLDRAQNRRGGKDAPTSPATPQMQAEPVRDSQISHRGFTAAYSVENGKVDHFLVSDGSQSWRIPSGLPVKDALIAIREQIDGKIDGAR